MAGSQVLSSLRLHATEGVVETPIEGLRLFRISAPVERVPGVYPTGICAIAQGAKRAYLGGTTHQYDSERYLCASVPIPVEAEVPKASPEEPVLGLLLDIDTPAMVDVVVKVAAGAATPTGSGDIEPGLTLGRWDEAFDRALARLLELLDDPEALSVLAEGRLRELMFVILRGAAGPALHRALGPNREVARAITYLRDHLGEPVSVEDLARRAGMSRAVFHKKFKATTSHSPVQFLKALRLNRAAMRISSGSSVGEVATEVGYVSQSQFSREFRRHFGRTPREWKASALPA